MIMRRQALLTPRTPHTTGISSDCWLLWSAILSIVVPIVTTTTSTLAQVTDSATNSVAPCQPPALSRLTRHQVAPGETLENIAQQYNLIPATLIGMNPGLQNDKIAVGSEILIPPYNGIRVAVPAGQTWREVAQTYNVRSDTLFEVNGCQTAPQEVFVPGVNWSPERPTNTASGSLAGYPLPQTVPIALGYGWQLNPSTGEVFFHSGLDLIAPTGTPVQAVDQGTVAFAGEQGSYGNLVVVNHQEGIQSRYAQLDTIAVKVGQQVKPGEVLGTVGTTGEPSTVSTHLHFEIRYNSSLGWVAENPASFLPGIRSEERRVR